MSSAPTSSALNEVQHQQAYADQMMAPNLMVSSIGMMPHSMQVQNAYHYSSGDSQAFMQIPQPMNLHMPTMPGCSQMNTSMSIPVQSEPMVPQTDQAQLSHKVPESPTNIPNSPSGTGGPIRKRRFSTAKIQPTRIKKVMQSDEEIGRMVASVPVAIGRAMEHFAEKFLLAASNAVVGLNGRTLGPSHMKLAMLANPHFAFLESVFKDITVPIKQLSDIPYNVCQVSQALGHPQNHHFGQSMNVNPVVTPAEPVHKTYFIPLAAVSSSSDSSLNEQVLPHTPAVIEKRRVSNGREKAEQPVGEKPKRGRPRKVKKEEKLIDDELANVPTERELMPPPNIIKFPRRNGTQKNLPANNGSNTNNEQNSSNSLSITPARAGFQRAALLRQNSQDHGDEDKQE